MNSSAPNESARASQRSISEALPSNQRSMFDRIHAAAPRSGSLILPPRS
jgi:hypothetical protein